MRGSFRHRKQVALLLVLFLLAGGNRLFAQPRTLSIGVLEAQDKASTARVWRPTAQFLSSRIPGYRFQIVPLTFTDVQAAIRNQAVDFFVVNPSLYVEAEVLYGAQRMATKKVVAKDKSFPLTGGVLFVRGDRKDIRSPADLRGKKMAIISPLCFSYRSVLRDFKAGNLSPGKMKNGFIVAGSNASVVRQVSDRTADAGIVRMGVLEHMAAEGKIEAGDFRVLKVFEDPAVGKNFPFAVSTRLYPGWAFAKIKATDNVLAEKVARVLLSIEPDHLAAVTAGYGGWTVPQNYQSVHECLKELRLSPYQDFGRVTWSGVVQQYWPWILGVLILLVFLAGAAGRVSMLNRNLVHSQKKLEVERRQYMSIYDSIEEMIYVVDPDTLEILYANEHLKSLLGFDPTGKTCYETIRGFGVPCPDCPNKRLFRHPGAVLRRESYSPKLKRHFMNIDQMIEWPDGRKVRFELAIDVTETKVAEKRIKESEQRYRLLAENTLDVIWQLDMDMRFTYLNPAIRKLLGYSPEELVGQPVSKYTTPEQVAKMERVVVEEVAKGEAGEGIIFETQLFNQKGEAVPVEIHGRVMWDNEGRPVSLQGTTRDIRERQAMNQDLKAAREQLLQSEKLAAVGQLSAGIAHEIKNPLAVILLSIDALEAGMDKIAEPTAKKIRMIRDAAKRANKVILQLLSFSRRANAQLSAQDVHQMIDETVSLARQSAKGKEIIFEKNFCGEKLTVLADHLLFEQALLNIFANAVDAIPGKGAVLIHTSLEKDSPQGPQVEIRIADTGAGIPPDVLNHIFEPFFTTKDQGKGTGLGLSTVYMIIEKHNGTVIARSQEGKGSEFILQLPLFEQEGGRRDE